MGSEKKLHLPGMALLNCLYTPTDIFSPLHPKLNMRDTKTTSTTIKTTEKISLYKLIKA